VPRSRGAFTIIELMVALALIVFIMTILSAAFAAAAQTFRDLKAQGDLAEQLRGVMTLLRRDLAAPHFDPNTKKLSDLDFWTKNNGPAAGGFFRIWQDARPLQGPPGTVYPSNGIIPSYVTSRSMLHFTVALPGLTPNDFFATDVGANAWTVANGGTGAGTQLFDPQFTSVFNQDQRFQFPIPPVAPVAPVPATAIFKSQYAEVVWWLTPSASNPSVTPSDNLGNPQQAPQQLFTLHRRYRLLWPESKVYQPQPAATNPPTVAIPQVPSVPQGGPSNGLDEISTPCPPASQTLPVNRMAEATIPPFRLGMQVNYPYGPYPNPNPPPPIFPPGTPITDATCAGIPLAINPNVYPSYILASGAPVDIMLDGVLSFDVRILIGNPVDVAGQSRDFVDLADPSLQPYSTFWSWTSPTPPNPPPLMISNNPQFATATGVVATTGPWVFDTWSQQAIGNYDYANPNTGWNTKGNNTSIPMYKHNGYPQGAPPPPPAIIPDLATYNSNQGQLLRIMAIQVTMRIYDFKTQTTRQVTMIQNL
jgi:type II secretory pathway pseudopilin PulG